MACFAPAPGAEPGDVGALRGRPDGPHAALTAAFVLGRPVARRSLATALPTLGVGSASVMIARCTIRTPVRRVLDVGTGGGFQAVHAARHADAVVGTDLSARAPAFARRSSTPGCAWPAT